MNLDGIYLHSKEDREIAIISKFTLGVEKDLLSKLGIYSTHIGERKYTLGFRHESEWYNRNRNVALPQNIHTGKSFMLKLNLDTYKFEMILDNPSIEAFRKFHTGYTPARVYVARKCCNMIKAHEMNIRSQADKIDTPDMVEILKIVDHYTPTVGIDNIYNSAKKFVDSRALKVFKEDHRKKSFKSLPSYVQAYYYIIMATITDFVAMYNKYLGAFIK